MHHTLTKNASNASNPDQNASHSDQNASHPDQKCKHTLTKNANTSCVTISPGREKDADIVVNRLMSQLRNSSSHYMAAICLKADAGDAMPIAPCLLFRG